MTRAALATGLAAALVLATTAPAWASPLIDPTVGGMVFTGPTSAHVSAIYWNPAATGLVRGFHVYFSGQLHADPYEIDRAAIDTRDGEPSETPSATRKTFEPVRDTLVTPGAFAGFTWDAGGDTLAVGVGVYLPFVDVQPGGHDALRYHSEGGHISSTYITAALSYRLDSDWIVGAALSGVYSSATLHFAFDQALELCATPHACDVENPDETSDFYVHAATGTKPDIAFSGGLLWKARDDLWLALSYHSPPGFARVSLPGTATVAPSAASGRTGVAHGDAEINYSLPHIVQVGARWDMVPGKWQLLGSVRWLVLSAVDQFDLRLAGPELRDAGVREWVLRYRGLEDAVQLETGLETPAGLATRWGARLRFDTGGTDEKHVAPEQIAGPTFDLSAGVQRVIYGGWSFTFAISTGLMLPRHVGTSAYSPSAQTDCVASGYDLDDCQSARVGSGIPTAAGDYQRYNFATMLGLSWETL
jgi:long-subunit fatty acid transport protein